MKTVAIHQPNYSPWCGFFAKMMHSDTFIFLDDVQMPRGRSWVHRTKIMEGGMSRWLSVPCHRSADALIKDVRVTTDRWAITHLKTLTTNYGTAPYFEEVMELIHDVYSAPAPLLAEFNIRLIHTLAEHLGVRPDCKLSSALPSRGSGEERIVSLVQAVGGERYLSGPGGNRYQSQATFSEAEIDLQVRDYRPRSYGSRGAGEFLEGLSILDGLFLCGRGARTLLSYD